MAECLVKINQIQIEFHIPEIICEINQTFQLH